MIDNIINQLFEDSTEYSVEDDRYFNFIIGQIVCMGALVVLTMELAVTLLTTLSFLKAIYIIMILMVNSFMIFNYLSK